VCALSPAQLRFVRALAGSKSVRAAAVSAGVSERAAYNYLQDADVLSAWRDIQSYLLREIAHRLLSASVCAIEALVAVASDAAQRPAARVAASRAILSYCLSYTQTFDESDSVDDVDQFFDDFLRGGADE